MTLILLLYLYMAFIAVFALSAIIQVGHLILLSVHTVAGTIATVLYISALIVIVGFSFMILKDISWSTPLFDMFASPTTVPLFK